MLIGIVSDTHGLLRDEAVRELRGCDLIVHAGDVGTPDVLSRLQTLAPVTVVRGNVDRGLWADEIPLSAKLNAGGAVLFVVHQRAMLEGDPRKLGYDAVISGHTHKARVELADNVVYLNPGSAGPRRFRLPVTLARIYVRHGALKPEIVTLLP